MSVGWSGLRDLDRSPESGSDRGPVPDPEEGLFWFRRVACHGLSECAEMKGVGGSPTVMSPGLF